MKIVQIFVSCLKYAKHTWIFISILMRVKVNLPKQTLSILNQLFSKWESTFMIYIFKASYKLKCPYVCAFVCVFTFEVLFIRLCAPFSQCRMSNSFRDSESLGKSNAKKWPWNLKKIIILIKCVKSLHKFFSGGFRLNK